MNKTPFIEISLSLVFFISAFSISGQVFAQSVPDDSMVAVRLSTISHILDQEKTKINWWWYGWLGGYSVVTIAQTGVWLSSDDLSTRQDMALGAATSFLAAAGQIISPVKPIREWDRIRQLPDNTAEARTYKLAESEKLLQETSMDEKIGRSWQTHALFGVVNLSSGLITWLGFKRSVWAGLGNFALNTAISEAQIFTQPTRAMKEYKGYMQKYSDSPVQKPALTWSLNVYPGGVSLRVGF